MNVEHFTEKAREAISEAAQIARQHNNSQVEVEHLLSALLAQEGGVVQQVIASVGGDLAAAQRIINDSIERMPQAYGGSEPGISPRLRKLLEEAWREMGTFHDEYLSVEHLLLAMFTIRDGAVPRALQAAGLTHENVL
ncbi:MAG TPA: Clp protease N-terminal domain-containing protein, partial [Ktedonobacteraceae bacterium]